MIARTVAGAMAQLRPQASQIVIRLGAIEALEPVVAAPTSLADGGGRIDRGRPVDGHALRPAWRPRRWPWTDPVLPVRPRSRNMCLKPVSSSVGMIASGHAEPASTTSTDRPAAANRAATTPPPAPLPTTTTSASSSRRSARARGALDRQRSDRRRLGRRRRPGRRVAHRRPERVRRRAGTRVGVGEEERQALEGLERRPTERDATRAPAQEVVIAGCLVELAKADRPSAKQHVGNRDIDHPQCQLQLPEIERLRELLEGRGAKACHPVRVAVDETAQHPAESGQLRGRPAARRGRVRNEASRLPRSPAPGAAGIAAGGPRGSPAGSRPG